MKKSIYKNHALFSRQSQLYAIFPLKTTKTLDTGPFCVTLSLVGSKGGLFLLESIWTVGEQVLILFILSGVGFVLGKAKMIGDKFSRDACQLVMYVVSPCMMVVAFQRSFEKDVFHNFCDIYI